MNWNVKPVKYRCPYCSREHRIEKEKSLEEYNSILTPMVLQCDRSICYSKSIISLYFDNKGCHYLINSCCYAERGIVPMDSIIQNDEFIGFRIKLHQRQKIKCLKPMNRCKLKEEEIPILFDLKKVSRFQAESLLKL